MPVLRSRERRRHVRPGRGRDAAEADQAPAGAAGRNSTSSRRPRRSRKPPDSSPRSRTSSTARKLGKAPLDAVPRPACLDPRPAGRYALVLQNRNNLVAFPMPMQALEQFEKRIRLFEQIVGKNIEQARPADRAAVRGEGRAAVPPDRAAHRPQHRDAAAPLRAEERHPPRRRSPLHPLLAREAAGDRRGHAVGQGARPHHGALCRSRRRRGR